MLADELSLLLEGARVTAQSMGRDGCLSARVRLQLPAVWSSMFGSARKTYFKSWEQSIIDDRS